MRNKVACELCDAPANMYCDSDRASLCWKCDNKVHGANFLVAKHTRCVLCHNCQAMTPWTAFGPWLPPSMSFCLSCVSSHNNNGCVTQLSAQSSVHNDNYDNDDDVESNLYENEEIDYCCDNLEYEKQVVPLTLVSNCVMPSSVSDCSRLDELEKRDDNIPILHNFL